MLSRLEGKGGDVLNPPFGFSWIGWWPSWMPPRVGGPVVWTFMFFILHRMRLVFLLLFGDRASSIVSICVCFYRILTRYLIVIVSVSNPYEYRKQYMVTNGIKVTSCHIDYVVVAT